jgi:tetratricopeptide (TPR) repeat protein
VGDDTPHLHLLLGKAYLDLSENSKAETELLKAVEGDPRLLFASYDLGVLYQRLGKLTEAAKYYDREIHVSSNESWSYESRGGMWLDQGNPDRAIPLFREGSGPRRAGLRD